VFKTFNLDSTWQLLTRGLGEEPRLDNFDLNRYRSILSTSTTTIYSNAYYGAYLKHDSEWKTIGLTCDKSAENDHLRVVQMMIKREIPAKAAAANSLSISFTVTTHAFLSINFVIAGSGAQKGVDRCFSAHSQRYVVLKNKDSRAIIAKPCPVRALVEVDGKEREMSF
jgi:hypothetical protein